ncbi:MAG: hypothetical protein KGL12_11790 [Rhodospirillales bacterium]|nr:hypothetical protein [Rhodospirillales bacterium]
MSALRDPAEPHAGATSMPLLQRYLATAIDLHRQVKHASWNLREPDTVILGKSLGKVALAMEYCCELLVAHAVMHDGTVNGTVQLVAARSFLPRYRLGRAAAHLHGAAVIEAMEIFAASARSTATGAVERGDRDTAALLIEIARCTERQIWMIRAAMPPAQPVPPPSPLAGEVSPDLLAPGEVDRYQIARNGAASSGGSRP